MQAKLILTLFKLKYTPRLFFSLNLPHWTDSVIESPSPDVCVCVYVCLRLGVHFLKPLIGHQVPRSVPGLSLVLPPPLFPLLSPPHPPCPPSPKKKYLPQKQSLFFGAPSPPNFLMTPSKKCWTCKKKKK